MVSLQDILSSNSRIATELPAGLVAVFVGATSGIGEYSLKQLAKHACRPRIYFVGRSQEAGDRIAAECKALNSDGEYIFVKADISLIRAVDDVCRDIQSKEKAVNLLFLSAGALVPYTKTSEGLHFATALVTYSRYRFILNLLPLLQQATVLRRVVSVFAGGKEGAVDTSDLQAWKVPMMSSRGHMSSIITLSLEAFAEKAPEVSFVHNFPGAVKTNLLRGTGVVMSVLKAIFVVIGPLIYIPNEECGERQLLLATSARYPAGTSGDAGASGVPLADGIAVAKGISGEIGSGVYTVDSKGESAGPKVEKLLAKLREEGTVEKVWEDQEEQFKRIAGLEPA